MSDSVGFKPIDYQVAYTQIDYLVAYTHGYSDAKEGRPADSRSRMKEALVTSNVPEVGARGNLSSQPSPQAMANRAKEFVATEEKAGRSVTMAEAMKHVYEKAGVPTR